YNIHEEEQKTGNDMDDVGRKIAHYLNLAPAVACTRGNSKHAEAFGPVLKTEAARKKAVPAKVLKSIPGAGPRHVHASGEQISPEFEVRLRVKNGYCLAGCPGRDMHPEQPLLRLTQKPVRVALSQVLLYRKRDAANIVKAEHRPRIETDLFELFAVEAGADGTQQSRFQQAGLKFLDAGPGEGFSGFIPVFSVICHAVSLKPPETDLYRVAF